MYKGKQALIEHCKIILCVHCDYCPRKLNPFQQTKGFLRLKRRALNTLLINLRWAITFQLFLNKVSIILPRGPLLLSYHIVLSIVCTSVTSMPPLHILRSPHIIYLLNQINFYLLSQVCLRFNRSIFIVLKSNIKLHRPRQHQRRNSHFRA